MTRTYSVSKKNKVRQLREYAAYEEGDVHAVLDAGLVAQVGFVQDGAAVVVPMIYGREGETIYLHGARKARIIRLLEETVEACMNVTLVDGLVLARSAFNSSMNYRSATIYGTPSLVADRDRKLHGMRVISEHSMPGRWDELREPLTREIKMTGVISLDITSASAKISTGMPDDEDEDYETPIWAGVIPVQTRLGEAIADDRVLEGVEPSAVVKALQNKPL
jgi:nitroimidazol reductase NimA-like FMN-containing flavoprotein (pyridoxamine 5'-phosphate oxidase superfamily)